MEKKQTTTFRLSKEVANALRHKAIDAGKRPGLLLEEIVRKVIMLPQPKAK